MAIKLYRAGSTHIENGVNCEISLIEIEHFSGVPEGWFLTVDDMMEAENGLQEEIEEVEKAEELPEEVEEINIDEMKNKEVRRLAELNEIPDFKTARIETLKEKLKSCHTLKAMQ